MLTQKKLNKQNFDSILLDIVSRHSYQDGLTYFEVTYNNCKLGYFHRDPWGDSWVVQEELSLAQQNTYQVETQDKAIALLIDSYRTL